MQDQPIGLIHRYFSHLPVTETTRIITLGEGSTPLIKLQTWPEAILGEFGATLQVYAKFDGMNPTGSFKDRGMTLAVTKAVEAGSRAIICASTGNTSASAAAYAARAGIKCFVVIPEGQIAMGKLAQAVIHNAVILQIAGNFDDAMQIVRQIVEEVPVTLVNSVNLFRLQGQKTAAFEIIDALLAEGAALPDYHFIPVGNGSNYTAYWLGYQEYKNAGKSKNLPKMMGIQAHGAAPYVLGRSVENPQTIATAIRIGNPHTWDKARAAQRASGGSFDSVTDEEILQAQQDLARTEGVFGEPAACAMMAGLAKAVKENKIAPNSTIVCSITGHGLKDSDIVLKQPGQRILHVPADISAVKALVQKYL